MEYAFESAPESARVIPQPIPNKVHQDSGPTLLEGEGRCLLADEEYVDGTEIEIIEEGESC